MPSRTRRPSLLRRLWPAALTGLLAGPTVWTGASSAAPVFATLLPTELESPAPSDRPGPGLRTGRRFDVDDASGVRYVEDPQISADGRSIAYSVRAPIGSADRQHSAIWISARRGGEARLLTIRDDDESSPRWSPTSRAIAYLSPRDDPRGVEQVWLADPDRAQPQRLSNVAGGVKDFAWSPDGTRLVLVVSEPDTAALVAGDRPIVVDRFRFKEDGVGYLGRQRTHLWLLDVATKQAARLTAGSSAEVLPAWSPDGGAIAFSSSSGTDVDRSDDWNLYAIDARPGAAPRRLTRFPGPDQEPSWASRPAWSPDGRWIAYLRGGPPKMLYYAVQRLAIVGATGGEERVATAHLDRNVSSPVWSRDGAAIEFLLEDDRVRDLARLPVEDGRPSGPVERLTNGDRYISGYAAAKDGTFALVVGSTDAPDEISTFDPSADERARLSRITHVNDSLVADVRLARTEPISVRSRDGTMVHGFVVLPPDYVAGRRYPTILRLHGGPVSQYVRTFAPEWQLLAANGYVVLGVNPRGSSGRGESWSSAIYADWGNHDGDDVIAAVDWAIKRGIADPARLGVGGWSYGAILTNYVIARDRRFRAATSGAGISNFLAGYGTDEYVREYETELGTPWKNRDQYLKLSSPFLHADRITTPTLFLVGEKDANVPALNSEQMYQALRSLGVQTQLVVYPGEYHGLSRPSFIRDRYERYLEWYGRYLK